MATNTRAMAVDRGLNAGRMALLLAAAAAMLVPMTRAEGPASSTPAAGVGAVRALTISPDAGGWAAGRARLRLPRMGRVSEHDGSGRGSVRGGRPTPGTMVTLPISLTSTQRELLSWARVDGRDPERGAEKGEWLPVADEQSMLRSVLRPHGANGSSLSVRLAGEIALGASNTNTNIKRALRVGVLHDAIDTSVVVSAVIRW